MKALAAASLALAMTTFAHAQDVTADSCVEIAVTSSGFHTSIVVPGEIMAAEHPLRRLFPDAGWIAVGWGDDAFYREPGGGTSLQGVRAVFAGGPTVLHVVALPVAPERFFASHATTRTTITPAGAAQLLRFFDREVQRAPDGAPIVVGEGHFRDRSLFLRGPPDRFHLFNNCNHWTARGLRSAGVPIGAVMTADSVMGRMRAFASRCPPRHGEVAAASTSPARAPARAALRPRSR